MTEVTPRDVDILSALTQRVRVFSLDQVARTWWRGSKNASANARGRLETLEEVKLVHIDRAPARPELPLQAPVIDWRPGEPEPDLGAASYRLQSRWKQSPIMTTCVAATKLAANQFGGHGGRSSHDVERAHDVHLAAVYLIYRERAPELLSAWVYEDRLRKERKLEKCEKLPDVILRLPSGPRVVEFGGAYSKEKLQGFHAYCKDRELPYEVW